MMCACTDPTNAGSGRWEPPLVDEEWHAMCHAIYTVFCRSGVGQLRTRSHSGNNRATMHWTVSEAKRRGDMFPDPTSEQKKVDQDTVRQQLYLLATKP